MLGARSLVDVGPLGIEPHFFSWSDFFCTVSCCVFIYIAYIAYILNLGMSNCLYGSHNTPLEILCKCIAQYYAHIVLSFTTTFDISNVALHCTPASALLLTRLRSLLALSEIFMFMKRHCFGRCCWGIEYKRQYTPLRKKKISKVGASKYGGLVQQKSYLPSIMPNLLL